MNPAIPDSAQPCPLARRLAALLYDGLILVAVWIIGSALITLPLNAAVEAGNIWFQAYLALLTWAYFASGWLLGGQTVGMRAWKIFLISTRRQRTSQNIGVLDSVVRVLVGSLSFIAFGLGFMWSLFRTDRAGWHDLASRSRLIVVTEAE